MLKKMFKVDKRMKRLRILNAIKRIKSNRHSKTKNEIFETKMQQRY